MIPKIKEKETEISPIPKVDTSILDEKSVQKSNNSKETPVPSIKAAPVKRKLRVKKKKTPQSENKLKNSKINDFFKPKQSTIDNNIVEKAGQSIINHLQKKARDIKKHNPKTESITQKSNPSLKRRPLKSQPKQFTPNQIKEILKILFKLNNFSQYSKIHKTIRRLNKIKVNQLLFALRLIKKFSNAPDNLLKNTLFNYITSDIKVQLS
jgi:hypothetical protein